MSPSSKTRRALPVRRNSLLSADEGETLEILTAKRRLGRTNLAVKSPSGDAPPRFDYAHLRVPLPPGLDGTEVHVKTKKGYPECYYLMRRSEDGFVSATGMFKAAFPWATIAEENAEKVHLRSKGKKVARELAGNIWVHPSVALPLSEEYGMAKWIVALLFPAPVAKSSKDHDTEIANPPAVEIPDRYIQLARGEPVSPLPTPKKERGTQRLNDTLTSASPSSTVHTPTLLSPDATRSTRSTSPTETPKTKMTDGGTDKKKTKKAKDSSSQNGQTATPDEPSELGECGDEGAPEDDGDTNVKHSNRDGTPPTSEAGDQSDDDDGDAEDDESVRSEDDGEQEPEDRSDDDSSVSGGEASEEDDILFAGQPASAEEVKRALQKAQAMTAKAREHDNRARMELSHKLAEKKRKADEDPEDAPALHGRSGDDSGRTYNMFKKFRLVVPVDPNESAESKHRRQTVKKRAVLGLAATLVVGFVLPYIS